MPANVGEMFYTGDVPWHGQGIGLAQPATMEEALKVGGLNWKVGTTDLLTADDPPTLVPRRKAIVRLDRPPGHPGRVLGVAHLGFRPLQNEDGAILFDGIFAQGRPLYHTGGYLGNGEVIWLLAKLERRFAVGKDDEVEPYALLANSHDGSVAIHIRLTTVRVVCQNTLAQALKEQGVESPFRRAHKGGLRDHAEAARRHFGKVLAAVDEASTAFQALARARCSPEQFQDFITRLLPLPPRPRGADQRPGVKRTWERRVDDVRAAQKRILELSLSGRGAGLETARGTFWGALNAVVEFVDHYQEMKGDRLASVLLGQGMEFKVKALAVATELSRAA